MRLSRYTRPELVLTDLAAEDVEETIQRLSAYLTKLGVVSDEEEVASALLDRERSHTTAMGQGIALPHATIQGLEEPILLLALAPEPVAFGPPETDPVGIFFVLLSPPGGESVHIKLLARICRLVRHPGFIDDLRSAGSGEEVLEIIERVDEQHV